MRAVDANTVENLLDILEELIEVDRSSQGNMTKVSLALQIGVFAGGAHFARVDDAESRIKDTAGDGVIALVGFVGDNLDDATAKNFIRRDDTELNTGDEVGHSSYYTVTNM